MDQNIQKALWLAVSVVLFVVVVSIGMIIVSQGIQLVEESEDSILKVANDLQAIKYDRYEGEVMGTRVVSALQDFSSYSGAFMVVVQTPKGGSAQYISTGTIGGSNVVGDLREKERATISDELIKAKDTTENTYINPSAKFKGEILYDANDVARAIRFIQQ